MKISSKIDKKVTLMRPLLDTQKKYLKRFQKLHLEFILMIHQIKITNI